MPIPPQALPAFFFYCYISAITPGPANLCSLSTALQRGRRAALQQWTGLFCGFFVVSLVSVFVAYFVGSAAGGYTGYLAFAGAAYLAYLALHTLRQQYADSGTCAQIGASSVTTAASPAAASAGVESATAAVQADAASAGTQSAPPAALAATSARSSFLRCFLTGLLVQLTNVKVMVYCVTALTAYVLPYTRSFGALLAVGCFLPFTGPVANLVWLFAGLSLQRLFKKHRKAVNAVLALSLLACAVSLAVTGVRSVFR